MLLLGVSVLFLDTDSVAVGSFAHVVSSLFLFQSPSSSSSSLHAPFLSSSSHTARRRSGGDGSSALLLGSGMRDGYGNNGGGRGRGGFDRDSFIAIRYVFSMLDEHCCLKTIENPIVS